MRISIVTPSYKQPEWLRLCAASVADQNATGVEIEHIVHDSMSGPEIAEALRPYPGVKLISEKDQGMYDAIDRGWNKATGDILCWLNCDEQFLPGTIEAVAAYFQSHPEIDVLFGDAIVVDGDGNYICSRQVLTPQLYFTWTSSLPVLSCAAFFRSRVLKTKGLSLDTSWKDLGDAELIIRMLKAGVRMGILRQYLASFVDTGDNRNLKPTAVRERELLTSQAPAIARRFAPLWELLHRLRRLAFGLYSLKPFLYRIYTLKSPSQRVSFDVKRPTFYWKTRMGPVSDKLMSYVRKDPAQP